MKVMTILGSPRRQGNTAKVLSWVEEELKSKGHEVDHANVVDYTIQGCTECFACKTGKIELCVIDDDANALLKRIIAADLVVFASPVFCWGFTAQMKALLDRCFCLVDNFVDNPDYGSRLKDKPLALVVTAAGPKENNAEFLIDAFYNIAQFAKAKGIAHLLVSSVETQNDIDETTHTRARAFAVEITTKSA